MRAISTVQAIEQGEGIRTNWWPKANLIILLIVRLIAPLGLSTEAGVGRIVAHLVHSFGHASPAARQLTWWELANHPQAAESPARLSNLFLFFPFLTSPSPTHATLPQTPDFSYLWD